MHSGHQPPRQRTFSGLLKPGFQGLSDCTIVVALCGCLGPCWDRGDKVRLRAAALLPVFAHTCTHAIHPSRLYTHVCMLSTLPGFTHTCTHALHPSSLCTHMCACSSPFQSLHTHVCMLSTLPVLAHTCTHALHLGTTSLIHTSVPFPRDLGHLLAITHPWRKFLFHPHRTSLPSRTQSPPAPVQSTHRDSWLSTSMETRLPARLHTSQTAAVGMCWWPGWWRE